MWPQCARPRPSPDASFQKDDSTKVIKELKDGDTGLPFNMEYSAISALLDALKDPNAIDDRKMLVSVPPCLESVARTLTSHLSPQLEQILVQLARFPKGKIQTRLERTTVEMCTSRLPSVMFPGS